MLPRAARIRYYLKLSWLTSNQKLLANMAQSCGATRMRLTCLYRQHNGAGLGMVVVDNFNHYWHELELMQCQAE